MANSRFTYVRKFELDDQLLPSVYLVVRIDGKGFHRFSERHQFEKPNDKRALELMNATALAVMNTQLGRDIFMAFGESDEYSFCFSKTCQAFNRRSSKILTTIVSLFTSFYIRLWPQFMPHSPLDVDSESPSFDGRIVQYPSQQEIIDYFSWRQVDTHINNLYNTCFWALVNQGGRTTAEAHAELKGTVAQQKNELLFNAFGTNYSKVDELFRRGTILLRVKDPEQKGVVTLHEDLLKPAFWAERTVFPA